MTSPELTKTCIDCRGLGRIHPGVGARSKDCETCNGTGRVAAPPVYVRCWSCREAHGAPFPHGITHPAGPGRPCDLCGNAFMRPEPPAAAADGFPLATLKLALDSMHEKCVSCEGSRYAYGTSAVWCYSCSGTGRVLTPAGREIVDAMVALLAGHFAPTEHGHSIS